VLKFIKNKIEVWRFTRTPLAQAIRVHTQEYFSYPSLAGFSEEAKERLVGDFCQRISLIYQSPNPAMACREALTEYTLLFAQLQVHCLTEAEKAEQFYVENPYISGQLWRHIRDSSDHHDELGKWKFEDADITDNDLVANANTRCALYLYYLNGINIVRTDLDDRSEGKDWFRPFLEACLVNEEHHIRDKLGLPILVPGSLGSLVYAGFMNYVLSGEQHPFFAWCRDFPNAYLAGEGPAPRLATLSANTAAGGRKQILS
jgi:hypothetical protein